MWRISAAAFFVFACIILIACGGGGGSSPAAPPIGAPPAQTTPVPLPSQSPFVSTLPDQTIVAASPMPLPTGGGYSGSIALPAEPGAVPDGTTLALTLTDQAPTQIPSISAAHVLDKTQAPPPPVSPLVYFSLKFSKTVSYSSAPGFTIKIPKDYRIPPNTVFWLALYDPGQPQFGWQLGFEGPIVVSGGSLVFTGNNRTITFYEHIEYWFVVYATSATGPSPTPAPTPTPTPVPVPTQSPFVVSTSTALPAATPGAGATPVPLPLPTAGGYSGAFSLPVPVAGIKAGTTVTEVIQDTAPVGPPQLQSILRKSEIARRRYTAADTSIVYISLSMSANEFFNPAPSLAITFPPAVPVTAGASYYLALYDPTRSSLGWQLDYEGPASIAGQQLSFSGATTQLNISANQTYWFAIYARSSSNPPPTPDPSPTPGATPGAILAVPGSFSFLAAGISQPLMISQSNYGGSFTAISSNTGAATVMQTGANTFSVTSVAAGTSVITVSNSLGSSVTVPVTVTTTTIPIN